MKNLIHLERLRRLSNHLSSGRLAQDYSGTTVIMCFNNLYFHENQKFTLPPWFVEELDYLFPNYFERNYMGYVIPLFRKKTSAEFVLPWFYGISSKEYEHLFIPGKQSPDLFGSNTLSPMSSPEQ